MAWRSTKASEDDGDGVTGVIPISKMEWADVICSFVKSRIRTIQPHQNRYREECRAGVE